VENSLKGVKLFVLFFKGIDGFRIKDTLRRSIATLECKCWAQSAANTVESSPPENNMANGSG